MILLVERPLIILVEHENCLGIIFLLYAQIESSLTHTLFYDSLIFGIWTKNLVCLEKAVYPWILFIVSTLGIYVRGMRQLYTTKWASH